MNDIQNYTPFNSEDVQEYRVYTTVNTSYDDISPESGVTPDLPETDDTESEVEETQTPTVIEENVEDVDEYMDAITSTDPDRINVDEEFERLVNDAEQTSQTSVEQHEEIPVDTAVEEDKKSLLSLRQLNESFLSDERTARFSSAVWYERARQLEVTIVGAGSIGSWASVLIARLGIAKMTIFDADDVDTSNMAGQFYETNDVGTNKATCLGGKIRRLVGGDILCNCHRENYNPRSNQLSRITIGAVDNMATRKQVFEAWAKRYRNDSTALLVDGRLSADELQIFVIRGDQLDRMEKYENEWLFSDEEAEETTCSFKQTSYMAAMIGALMCNCVVNHCANLADENVMYDLPFFINYNSETMFFKAPNI